LWIDGRMAEFYKFKNACTNEQYLLDFVADNRLSDLLELDFWYEIK